MSDDWKFIHKFDVHEYSCGLRSGQVVRVTKDIVVRDHNENPTGDVHRAGEIWKVLPGSKQDPGVVFLCQPDGKTHTWDEDSSIFEHFEIVP